MFGGRDGRSDTCHIRESFLGGRVGSWVYWAGLLGELHTGLLDGQNKRLTGTMAMDLEFMAFTHLNFTFVISHSQQPVSRRFPDD